MSLLCNSYASFDTGSLIPAAATVMQHVEQQLAYLLDKRQQTREGACLEDLQALVWLSEARESPFAVADHTLEFIEA